MDLSTLRGNGIFKENTTTIYIPILSVQNGKYSGKVLLDSDERKRAEVYKKVNRMLRGN
jgi:hypothetical protein